MIVDLGLNDSLEERNSGTDTADEDDNINVTIGPTKIVLPKQKPVPFSRATSGQAQSNSSVASKETAANSRDSNPSVSMEQTVEDLRLLSILNADSYYEKVENVLQRDLAVKSEIDTLLKKSVFLTNNRCVAVHYCGRVLLVSTDTPLSSRMMNIFWNVPLPYQQTTLDGDGNSSVNLTDLAYKNLTPRVIDHQIQPSDVIVIFAAKYEKKWTMIAARSKSNEKSKSHYGSMRAVGGSASNAGAGAATGAMMPNSMGTQTFKDSKTGYLYTEFAALVVQYGKIIDIADHGRISNVRDMILKHRPKKIFYNSLPNEALDVFMRYPYQPFYGSFDTLDKLAPVRINRINDGFNTLAFCRRQDAFCSFCIAMRDYRGLLFQLPTCSKPEPWNVLNPNCRRFRPLVGGRRNGHLGLNQFNQPTHNARRLNLTYASKTPNAFNGFDKSKKRRPCCISKRAEGNKKRDSHRSRLLLNGHDGRRKT